MARVGLALRSGAPSGVPAGVLRGYDRRCIQSRTLLHPAWTRGDGNLNAGANPVAYLQHGLLDTCATFLMNGQNASRGFILADLGFDVWQGNTRGNTFSSFSIQKNIEEDEFWDFSLDEIAKYDLPATLQYVLDKNGAEQLSYVAHSQETGSAHALFSTEHPTTKRIAIAVMLSPVARVRNTSRVIFEGTSRHRVQSSSGDDLLASVSTNNKEFAQGCWSFFVPRWPSVAACLFSMNTTPTI